MNAATRLSITEHAVLGVIGEGPSHGFAVSKLFAADGELGRVYTVRRPLVYRALARLIEAGCAKPISTEKGTAGPNRTIHRITPQGRRRIDEWLCEPVEHVRDLRLEFLLKLALLERSGRSPSGLIESQQAALTETLTAIDHSCADRPDHVELWRRHNATAAAAYLDDLATIYSSASPTATSQPLRGARPDRL